MNSIFNTGDIYRATSSNGVVILRVAGTCTVHEHNTTHVLLVDVHKASNRYFAPVIENGNAAVVHFNKAINDMDIIELQDRIFDGGEL